MQRLTYGIGASHRLFVWYDKESPVSEPPEHPLIILDHDRDIGTAQQGRLLYIGCRNEIERIKSVTSDIFAPVGEPWTGLLRDPRSYSEMAVTRAMKLTIEKTARTT